MQSLREGIPAEWFAHRPLHQGPAFEDHDHILAGVLGLVRQLRPRAGGRRVRRVHGHEQAHPDEEVLRDGLRLPGEIPSQLFLVKVASIRIIRSNSHTNVWVSEEVNLSHTYVLKPLSSAIGN